MLKDWGEKTRYYSWMHKKSGEYYSQLNNALSIPMIIISTMTASANFTMAGNSQMSEERTIVIPILTGTASVIAAILSALTKFLQSAELSSKHEDCHRNFNKLTRNICLELSLPPIQRREPYDACHVFRSEYDRLITESPSIPTFIIKKFNLKFPTVRNKPEIASEFGKIPIYGRDKNIIDNEARFQKIRTFYKWWSATGKRSKQRISEESSDLVVTPSYPKASRLSIESLFGRPKSKSKKIDEESATVGAV